MNIYALLTLFSVILMEAFSVEGFRRNVKMGSVWGRRSRNDHGRGSFALRGTAGGISTSDDSSTLADVSAKLADADCVQAGFFASPYSCMEFYRCVDWMGDGTLFSIFHFTCPVGTVFDEVLDTCNYLSAVNRPECRTGTVVTIDQTSGTGATVSEDQDVDQGMTEIPDSDEQTDQSETEDQIDQTESAEESEEDESSTPTETKPDGNESTTNSSTSAPSPAGIFSITCYADNKYRRHPLYCNKYYYCIYNIVWNVPIFTCPANLIFDEENQICAREAMGVSPDCERAPYPTPIQPEQNTTTTIMPLQTTSSTDGPAEVNTEANVLNTTPKVPTIHPDSLYDCPALGYYPFEGDCIRFYKCVETEDKQIIGLLYRCPDGFGYSEDKMRCLKKEDLPTCQRVTQPAHLRVDAATVLHPQDLLWFFNN